jgi:hypothetical protein
MSPLLARALRRAQLPERGAEISAEETQMTEKKTLLMLGDSLVEWGDWETLLPDLRVISRGRADELCEGLSVRLTAECR